MSQLPEHTDVTTQALLPAPAPAQALLPPPTQISMPGMPNPVNLETTTSLLEQARDQTDLDHVQTVVFQLRKLREQGILVDVDIHGLTMFSRRVSLAELGIPLASARGKTVTPGVKFMAPRDFCRKLMTAGQRLRDVLDKHSDNVTGFRPFRYIYYLSWQTFIQKWTEIHNDFKALKQQALDNRDEWERVYLEECALRAQEAWTAIMATNGKHEGALILELQHSTKVFGTCDEFVAWIVEIGKGTFPTADHIRRHLRADYYTAVLLSSADIEAEQTRMEEEVARSLQAQAGQAQARAQVSEAHHRERVAESEADLAMRAIYAAQLEHARTQLAITVSPFEELFQNLRAQIYHDAREMEESIRKNGFLNPQVGKRIHNLMDLFRMKDAVGDMELETLLQTVAAWADQTPKQTGKAGQVAAADRIALEQLSTALNNVVIATHESARAVAERLERGADIAAVEL
jgi:hypothetical protein